MRIATYLFAVCALALASVSQAAVTEFKFMEVTQDKVAGHKTFDLMVTGTGQFTGVQMLAELTAGAFYQDPVGGDTAPNGLFFPLAPTVEFDTFMSMGGRTTATAATPIIPGGAVNLGGASGLTFSTTKIDATWAPPGANPVMNPTDYFVGRFTLNPGAAGSIKLLGLTFQEPNFQPADFAIEAGVILPPGGGGGDGIFESTPAAGSVLDFGFGPNTRSLQLAVRNVAAVGADEVAVAQAVISGANASLFSTPGFAPLDLVAGAAATNIGVQFNGIGTPGVYSAILTLLDDAGATLGTYTLTAQVPEPSTIALAGLGLVGLVGFLRRRG